MRTTLVLPAAIASELRTLANLDVETGGVLIARLARTPTGNMRLLATDFIPVPDEAYDKREMGQLLVTSSGYVPGLGVAEQKQAIPLWFHTHPGDGSSPEPSKRDAVVDRSLADVFRIRADSTYYGALIISHRGHQLTFSGHLESDEQRIRIDRLMTAGDRFELERHYADASDELPPLFDRNIRAFGGDVQRVLADLTIAVVGCGGTGSSVAEQLVRLGVRNFILVDPDAVADSNLTRLYGSTPEDVGRPKVDVVGDHLQRIAPDCTVTRVDEMVTVEHGARALTDADIVFGCTDDNAGRLVLSRLASYMLIPVIDCGVLLTSDARHRLDGIHGRVTVLYPGAACLVCRERIDIARAGSEMLTPAERDRRVDEGYAPALEGVEPAVVVFTTLVAATAVGELLERLTRYGVEPPPSEVLLRVHDREVSTNQAWPRERHYCHAAAGKLGRGDTEPFLEQTWAA